jgi:hypothetical protein
MGAIASQIEPSLIRDIIRDVAYRWINVSRLPGSDGSKHGDYLVGSRAQSRLRGPTNAPHTLCRVFAELVPTRETIAAFANEYGSIGLDVSWVPPSGEWKPGETAIPGEPLGAWTEAIRDVRHALLLLDSASGAKRDEVVVEWHPNRRRSRCGRFVVIVREGRERRRWLVREDRGEWRLALLHAAVQIIDHRLAQSAVPSLIVDRDSRACRLQHDPDSLLGVIWLQVAALAEGKHQHRRCAACARWFAVAPDLAGTRKGARADARYCPGSDACRARAYRARKRA